MAFRDILVALASYPEPTPPSVVEDAVSVASLLGAHIAALSCEMHVQVPGHFMLGAVVGLPGIIAAEAGKSRKNALNSAGSVRSRRGEGRRFQRLRAREMQDLRSPGTAGRICAASRSHHHAGVERSMVCRGRDLRVGQTDPDPAWQKPRSRGIALGTVAVAWDFSRAAARASDAMPLVEKARKVRIVTILNEKRLDSKHSAEELGEEPVPARRRNRAGPGRRQGPADRQRSRS